VKLVDADETIVLVTGAAAERDLELAGWLKAEIDRRGAGHAYRRGVTVADEWYMDNGVLQQNPAIAIGGPGANALTQAYVGELPTLYSEGERVFVQGDLDGDVKRVNLWGADAAATASAVDAFVVHGFLDDLLRRIWRFRMETLV
jgi:hypothetical protein